MADAHGSGPCVRKDVRVQLPPRPHLPRTFPSLTIIASVAPRVGPGGRRAREDPLRPPDRARDRAGRGRARPTAASSGRFLASAAALIRKCTASSAGRPRPSSSCAVHQQHPVVGEGGVAIAVRAVGAGVPQPRQHPARPVRRGGVEHLAAQRVVVEPALQQRVRVGAALLEAHGGGAEVIGGVDHDAWPGPGRAGPSRRRRPARRAGWAPGRRGRGAPGRVGPRRARRSPRPAPRGWWG